MRSLEPFFIGFLLGGLLGFTVYLSRETPKSDTVVESVVVRDTLRDTLTIRTSCCERYLEHIAREHAGGE